MCSWLSVTTRIFVFAFVLNLLKYWNPENVENSDFFWIFSWISILILNYFGLPSPEHHDFAATASLEYSATKLVKKHIGYGDLSQKPVVISRIYHIWMVIIKKRCWIKANHPKNGDLCLKTKMAANCVERECRWRRRRYIKLQYYPSLS